MSHRLLKMSVIGIALMNAAGFAFAEKWIEVAASPKVRYLVDEDSLERQGTLVTGWTKFVFRKNPPKIGMKPLAYQLSHETFSCTSHDSRVLLAVSYDNEGSSLQEVKNLPYEETVPGSAGELMRAFVCAARVWEDAPKTN
ncbi:hypothetical protein QCE73_00030 [Caballeronia sp. LZ029]|uniref:surface-adhesin E family protein n=1 Tax=Caballeronia sp. LZ029 TaxID=3038564 RepID=UPI0028566345|nr:surface-adhesin E family protein [Caballeronia sp. LZ029]MDR5741535.1 hypothetical protein [Caballeronia sp. LZ029]